MTAPTQVASPKKQRGPVRRWLRRGIGLVLFLLLLVALLPFALRIEGVRSALASRIGDAVGRPVRIGGASGWWVGGFDLDDIEVGSGNGFDRPLLRIESVHVDVGFLDLLRGRMDLAAVVRSPHLVLLEAADGRRNVDGLFTDAGDGGTSEPGHTRMRLELVGGTVESLGADPAVAASIEDLALTLALGAQGSEVKATARFVGMRVGGGDVALEAQVFSGASAGDESLRLVTSDPLDLGRLAPLLAGAGAIEALQGTLSALELDLRRGAHGAPSGKVVASVTGLDVRFLGGATFAARTLTLGGDVPQEARGEGTLSLRIEDLVASRMVEGDRPSVLREPLVEARAKWRFAAENEPFRLTEAHVEAGPSARVELAEPFVLAEGEEPATGKARVLLDLARLAPLFGDMPLLQRVVSGKVLATVHATREGTGPTRVAAAATIDALAVAPGEGLPHGWREPRAEIHLRWARRDGVDRILLQSLATSFVKTGERLKNEPLRVTLAEAGIVFDGPFEARLDLAAAAPLLAASFGLEPGGRLGGRLDVALQCVASGGATTFTGQATLADFHLQRTAAASSLHLREFALQHDVRHAPGSGELSATRLVATLPGLALDLSGARWQRGEQGAVFAPLSIAGDAALFAPVLAGLLGADYADLQGSGAIAGRHEFVQGAGRLAETGSLAGRTNFGAWRTSGIDLRDVVLSSPARAAGAPLGLQLEASVNGGKMDVRVGLGARGEQTPWTLLAKVTGVDTAPLLTHRGLARYMAFALPSLLPADSQTPALSGRLDADVDLKADDLAGELRDRSLAGTAAVRLAEGEIRQSTLFRGESMGKLAKTLAVVVPEAGRALQGLARALLFNSVDSRSTIKDRTVHVETLELVGRTLRMSSTGRVTFDKQVDLQSSLVLQGGLLAKILPDGAIPLQVTGPLADPSVTPRIDLGKLAGSGVAKEAVDRLKDIFGK